MGYLNQERTRQDYKLCIDDGCSLAASVEYDVNILRAVLCGVSVSQDTI